ncbi:hypothetical protein [Vibrio fortis]|uniref:hypothetical protein n=1 Tax=Vibrio fortis TaxID=212667 RepID=UPI0038CD9C7D
MLRVIIRHMAVALFCTLPFCSFASIMEVDLSSGQVKFDVLLDSTSLDNWKKVEKGQCTYFHKLTQQTVQRGEQTISGYLLQARLNCYYGSHSSDYYALPELFVVEYGEASVSFSDYGTQGFYYSLKFI